MTQGPASRPFRVYPILMVGLLSISFSPILVRFASEAPGEAVAVWRTVMATLLLAPAALVRIGPEVRRFTRREHGFIVAAGVVLAFHFITWIESLYHTTVASASVLVAMSPIFLAVLGFLFLRERLALRTVVAVLVAVLGAVLIGVGDAGDARAARAVLGNSLALGAALLVSVYLIIGRVVRQQTSWLAYVFPVYTVVALTTVGFAVLRGVPLFGYEPAFYGLCALMALGPQLLGHGSINYAIKYFPAAIIGLLTLLEPVVASVAAYVLFGEQPGLVAAMGMALVLAAVLAALWPRRRSVAAS